MNQHCVEIVTSSPTAANPASDLDAHQDSISIAVANTGREPGEALCKIPDDGVKLLKRLDKLGPRDQIRAGDPHAHPHDDISSY